MTRKEAVSLLHGMADAVVKNGMLTNVADANKLFVALQVVSGEENSLSSSEVQAAPEE
jgi:hypothetical protein